MTITNGLITLSDYIAYVGYDVSGAKQTQVESAIETASQFVEQWCGRQFHDEGSATVRYFDSEDDDLDCVEVDDFSTATGLVVEVDYDQDGTYETTLSASAYQLHPLGGRSPILGAVPYSAIELVGTTRWFPEATLRDGLIRVTARWGWASVPTPVKRACLVLAHDVVRDPETNYGGVAVTDIGMIGAKVPRRVRDLLAPYRRAVTIGIA